MNNRAIIAVPPRPVRIQRKRTRGWRMRDASPNGLPVVSCTRPGPWGNPWVAGEPGRLWIRLREEDGLTTTLTAEYPYGVSSCAAWSWHRDWLLLGREIAPVMLPPTFEPQWRRFATGLLAKKRAALLKAAPALRGKNLACFCPEALRDGSCPPCHADTVLELVERGFVAVESRIRR